MAKVHHATLKRIKDAGFQLIETQDGGFRLLNPTTQQLSLDSWDSAKEAADAACDTENPPEWQTKRSNHCGVMPRAYHDRYEGNPHGPGCGDGLDIALRDACTEDGEDLNLAMLKQIGEQAGLWRTEWEQRNPGMQRMNLANRLRGMLRNDAEATVQIGDHRGRFGVPYRPAARKAKRKANA